MGGIEAVVARERPAGATSVRLSLGRCVHCAMPVRRSLPSCWSCGLDPARTGAPDPSTADAATAATTAPSTGRAVRIAGAVLVVLVVLGGLALLTPTGDSRGVRGLAARIRGDGWPRAALRGASAEFPAPPVHRTVPAGRGLPAAGEALAATGQGVTAELLMTDLAAAGPPADPRPGAQRLADGYAGAIGGRVIESARVSTSTGAGVDALVEVAGGVVRVRATVAGTIAFVLAVTGPAEAFDRFTGSFHPAV